MTIGRTATRAMKVAPARGDPERDAAQVILSRLPRPYAGNEAGPTAQVVCRLVGFEDDEGVEEAEPEVNRKYRLRYSGPLVSSQLMIPVEMSLTQPTLEAWK